MKPVRSTQSPPTGRVEGTASPHIVENETQFNVNRDDWRRGHLKAKTALLLLSSLVLSLIDVGRGGGWGGRVVKAIRKNE